MSPVDTVRSSAARAWSTARDHPLLAVFLIALLVRIAVAVVAELALDGYLIPDEGQYLGLAESVASGEGADAWKRGYGPELMSTTGRYTWPLTISMWVFGPHRFLGQLLAAFGGAAVAVVTARLAMDLVDQRVAFAAGLAIGLWPSQIVHSAAAIRESFVWLGLVGVAYALRRLDDASTPRGELQLVALLCAALFFLAHLRNHTFVVITWCVIIALVFGARRMHRVIAVGAIILVVLLPMEIDAGPGGVTFVLERLDTVAETRRDLAVGAETAIVPTTSTSDHLTTTSTTRAPTTSVPGQTPTSVATTRTSGAPPTSTTSTATTVPAGPSEDDLVVEDESVSGNVRVIPRGLVANTLRPHPFEGLRDRDLALAGIENIAWYVLYGVAIAGLVVAWRRRAIAMLMPALMIGALLVMNSLLQGNVGTAFRHRGQLLWALVLFAALAVDRWRALRLADRGLDAA